MPKEQKKIKVKGVHTISFFDMREREAQVCENAIVAITKQRVNLILAGLATEHVLNSLRKQYFYYKEILMDKYLLRQQVIENITTTAGRVVIAQLIAGNYIGPTGAVTHCAVGDDNTSPNVADTILGNETSRKALSDGNNNSNQSLLETFFSTSEAVDTHEEFGFFIDGTGAADSGVLMNRFTQTIVKSNTESMNVQTTITYNDA